MVLGRTRGRLRLPAAAAGAAFWRVLYAGFANWLATLLAALWGAGAGYQAAPGQEAVIMVSRASLSVAVIAANALVIWGLCRRGRMQAPAVSGPSSAASGNPLPGLSRGLPVA